MCRTVATLTAAGCKVSMTARPSGFGSHEVFELYKQLLASAENNGLSDDEMAAAVASAAALAPDDTTDRAKQTRWIAQSHHAWHKAHMRRLELRSSWDAFFAEWDILICPICAATFFPSFFSTSTLFGGPFGGPFPISHGFHSGMPHCNVYRFMFSPQHARAPCGMLGCRRAMLIGACNPMMVWPVHGFRLLRRLATRPDRRDRPAFLEGWQPGDPTG